MTMSRLAALGREEPSLLALAQRLLTVAELGLPAMLLPGKEAFAFTMAGRRAPDGSWTLDQRGTSTRYAAITALGVRFLPEDRQRAALGGRTAQEFTGLLVESLPGVTNLGDAALIAWAAAETAHPKLSDALARVEALDAYDKPQYTVEAAWVLSAYAAARDTVDVERRFASARDRLLRARIGAGPLFPHATAPGLLPWYRAHVSCFADQTYPLQALALAHASGDGDAEALAAAEACAQRICELQGDGGQWWWHYDARTGGVIEGYPVYSVHQHAMAPTALFDLTDSRRRRLRRGDPQGPALDDGRTGAVRTPGCPRAVDPGRPRRDLAQGLPGRPEEGRARRPGPDHPGRSGPAPWGPGPGLPPAVRGP